MGVNPERSFESQTRSSSVPERWRRPLQGLRRDGGRLLRVSLIMSCALLLAAGGCHAQGTASREQQSAGRDELRPTLPLNPKLGPSASPTETYDFPRARPGDSILSLEPSLRNWGLESTLGVVDHGIFSDLDPQVQLHVSPKAIGKRPISALIDGRNSVLQLYAGAVAIKVYPLASQQLPELGEPELRDFMQALRPGDLVELSALLPPNATRTLLEGEVPPGGDQDGDGIPDGLDLYLGALKTALNGDAYDQAYFTIPYPNGDVPRDKGACTDVIVRAARNAGIDLQQEIHEDIARSPRSYPMVTKANANIDHRRVRTMLPWFLRHFVGLETRPDGISSEPRPGDIILMDTIESRAGPDHIGVLHGGELYGTPLEVINNWTTGSVTESMDLLSFVPVTHHFRLSEHFPNHPIPDSVTTLVVTIAADWGSSASETLLFRRSQGDWSLLRQGLPSQVGARGLAWGRGLHGQGRPPGAAGELKAEGDQRAPAGVFVLGRVRARGVPLVAADLLLDRAQAAAANASSATLTARSTPQELVCVDDPNSVFYGKVIDAHRIAPEARDWNNAEEMARADGLYDFTIDVHHNTAAIGAGFGSCIFIHASSSAGGGSLGCTTLSQGDLAELGDSVRQANGRAVLVTLPRSEYQRLRRAWALPELPS